MPTKGDWVSTCLNDMKELKISHTFDEIKLMSKNQFNNLLKERLRENAFEYLVGKQGSKGSELKYLDLSMSEYLLPTNSELSIEEKQRLFGVKTRMTIIPSNYPKPNETYICHCGLREDMKHIYICEMNNEEKEPELEYEKIHTGNISEQIKVFRKFEINFEKRRIIRTKETFPCDPCEIHYSC